MEIRQKFVKNLTNEFVIRHFPVDEQVFVTILGVGPGCPGRTRSSPRTRRGAGRSAPRGLAGRGLRGRGDRGLVGGRVGGRLGW